MAPPLTNVLVLPLPEPQQPCPLSVAGTGLSECGCPLWAPWGGGRVREEGDGEGEEGGQEELYRNEVP